MRKARWKISSFLVGTRHHPLQLLKSFHHEILPTNFTLPKLKLTHFILAEQKLPHKIAVMANLNSLDFPRSSNSTLNRNEFVEMSVRHPPTLERDEQQRTRVASVISNQTKWLWGVTLTDILFAALTVWWVTVIHPPTETGEHTRHVTRVALGLSLVLHIAIVNLLLAALCIPNDMVFRICLLVYLYGSLVLVVTSLLFYIFTLVKFWEFDTNEKLLRIVLCSIFLTLKPTQIVLVLALLNSCFEILESQQELRRYHRESAPRIPYPVRYYA